MLTPEHRRASLAYILAPRVCLCCLAGFVHALSGRTTDASPLLGGTQDGIIYDIDVVSGIASNPRDTGLDFLRGLSFSPDGILYGYGRTDPLSDWPNPLFVIDEETGASELVGNHAWDGHDFDFDPATSLLYAARDSGGGVLNAYYTIDPDTSDLTIIGRLDLHSASLAFAPTGDLFALGYGLSPESDLLQQVDKATGKLLWEIALDVDLGQSGLAFMPDGTLLIADGGPTGTGNLHSFDFSSGTLSTIGSTGLADGVVALAFIPEPGTLVFFGVIAAPLMCRKRRRH